MASKEPTIEDYTNLPDFRTTKELQLKKWDEPWVFNDCPYPRVPKTPSEWFSKHFPEQTQMFGTPFLELVERAPDGITATSPLSPNLDFLAAILGGDRKLGHHVVYYEPEMLFYFFDCKDQLYKATSEEKLGNLLRALLIRCAEELPGNVSKFNLFQGFRSSATTRNVLQRARSILAADGSFFDVDSGNARLKGPEVYERVARVFVQQVLERQPGQVLTLTNAYLVFCQFLKQKDMPPVKRHLFKRMFAPIIRDLFDVGLRNDVVDQKTNKQTTGWKDLCTFEAGTQLANN